MLDNAVPLVNANTFSLHCIATSHHSIYFTPTLPVISHMTNSQDFFQDFSCTTGVGYVGDSECASIIPLYHQIFYSSYTHTFDNHLK